MVPELVWGFGVSWYMQTTGATIEVHPSFSEVPQFESLRPLPKTGFGEIKKLYQRIKKNLMA